MKLPTQKGQAEVIRYFSNLGHSATAVEYFSARVCCHGSAKVLWNCVRYHVEVDKENYISSLGYVFSKENDWIMH